MALLAPVAEEVFFASCLATLHEHPTVPFWEGWPRTYGGVPGLRQGKRGIAIDLS